MFYNIMRAIFSPFINLLFPTKIIGPKKLPKGGAISVCNHLSATDTFVIAIKFRKNQSFLGKKELFKNPVIGWLLRALGAISIDRSKSDMVAMRECVKRLKAGRHVTMFPEGTRNKEGEDAMLELKGGACMFALKSGAPIVPMMLYRKPKLFCRNYLIVSEPLTFEEFQGKRLSREVLDGMSEQLTARFASLREEVNAYAESKKRKRLNSNG